MEKEIFRPDMGQEIVNFAREELVHYQNVTGFAGPEVVVDAAAAQESFGAEMATLANDGFVIGWNDGKVIIGAANDRGLLYGVYEYVEKAMGMRFMDAPYDEVDTGVKNTAWPEQTVVENPTFPYRGGNMHMARTTENFCYNIDRLPKFRLNNVLIFSSQLELLKENIAEYRKRGICVTLGGHCWPYLFYNQGSVTPDEMMEAHPDWHSLVDGKRLICDDSQGQFCLTNEDAVNNFVNNTLKMADEYAGCIDIISLWPNDTYGLFCECEECAKHTYSDLVLRLVNRVAEAIAPKYPHIQIEMLAYDDFTAAPKETVPAQNVLVNFAAIQRDYRIPIYSLERRNINFMNDLRGWRRLREDLPMIVYEYYRLDSIPKSGMIQYELERFYDEGLIGVMEDTFQVNNPGQRQNAIGFMTYLECKLMWNLNQSVDTLQREIVNILFKEQAPVVWSALRRLEQMQFAGGFYNLVWHEWRKRSLQVIDTQVHRVTFTVGEMNDICSRLDKAIAESDGMVKEYLSRMTASIKAAAGGITSVLYQLKAQQIWLGGGTDEDAIVWIRKALEAKGAQPADLGDKLPAYIKAYSDLPAEAVCILKNLDSKDRVGRVEIMHMCEHICEKAKKAGECMTCTMPVCMDAVLASPMRYQI